MTASVETVLVAGGYRDAVEVKTSVELGKAGRWKAPQVVG
jgi:hypothetical protein